MCTLPAAAAAAAEGWSRAQGPVGALTVHGDGGAQVKSRDLRERSKAIIAAAAAAAAEDGDGGGGSGAGGWAITLCPADDWQKAVGGRRLGPLQVC